MPPEKLPPVYVPVNRSVVPAPEVPADAGKLMVTYAVPPLGAISPSATGNGAPLLLPSVTPVNCTAIAVPVPCS